MSGGSLPSRARSLCRPFLLRRARATARLTRAHTFGLLCKARLPGERLRSCHSSGVSRLPRGGGGKAGSGATASNCAGQKPGPQSSPHRCASRAPTVTPPAQPFPSLVAPPLGTPHSCRDKASVQVMEGSEQALGGRPNPACYLLAFQAQPPWFSAPRPFCRRCTQLGLCRFPLGR